MLRHPLSKTAGLLDVLGIGSLIPGVLTGGARLAVKYPKIKKIPVVGYPFKKGQEVIETVLKRSFKAGFEGKKINEFSLFATGATPLVGSPSLATGVSVAHKAGEIARKAFKTGAPIVGAGAGAGIGALSSKKKKKRGAAIGAGGGLAAGAGASILSANKLLARLGGSGKFEKIFEQVMFRK